MDVGKTARPVDSAIPKGNAHQTESARSVSGSSSAGAIVQGHSAASTWSVSGRLVSKATTVRCFDCARLYQKRPVTFGKAKNYFCNIRFRAGASVYRVVAKRRCKWFLAKR